MTPTRARQYYLDIKRIVKGGYGVALWSRQRCLHALHLYVTDEGHFPVSTQLRNADGLPGQWTVRRHFGGLIDYCKAYTQTCAENGPPGRDLPDGEAAVMFLIPKAPPPQPPTDGVTRPCLACGERWYSPDRRKRWICTRCTKGRQDSRADLDDGDWMCGVPVQDRGAR